MSRLIDLTGQRFGLLTALSYTIQTLSSGRRMSSWKLICDCGKTITVLTCNLMRGKQKSCGCDHDQQRKLAGKDLSVTRMPEYRIYRQMLDRCYLETAPNYGWYGAKGVTVCDRWRFGEDGRTGFLCFYGDMGPRPDGLTLDRSDPRLSYSPSNCTWSTWEYQASNKREHYMDDVQRQGLAKFRAVKRRYKCTDAVIQDIQRRLAAGQTQMSIQAETGIHQTTVSLIKVGKVRVLGVSA